MTQFSAPAAARYSEWRDPRFRRLLLFQVAFGYAYSALILVPKFATASLGAGPREVGALAACSTLAAVLTAPFCGFWLDRGGYRLALVAGTGALLASTLPFGYLAEVGALAYGLRIAQGVGNALVLAGVGACVTRLVPPANHGRAFGTAGAASLVMNGVASSLTERLAERFGWGFAYEVAGGACAFAFGMALTEPRGAPLPHARPLLEDVSLGRARRRAAGVATLAAGAGFGMLVTFTQPYALSLGAQHVAILFVGYTLTALIARLGLGNAVDRWGRRRATLVALWIYAATVLLAAALRPATLFPLGLAFGLAHGLAWPALSALAVEQSPLARTGSALARTQGLFAAGTLLAVWVGGLLVDQLGYALAFVSMGLGVTAGALALLFGPRPASAAAGVRINP